MNIDFIDNQIFEIVGNLVSCVVSALIIFQYFDNKYSRMYRPKILYFGLRTICCLANMGIYFLHQSFLNLAFWVSFVLLISRCFYYEENECKSGIKYYLINIAFVFACSVSEAIGGVLVGAGVKLAHIDQSEAILSFAGNIGGTASAIFLYYLVLRRMFISEKTRKIPISQYTIYVVITAYVLINIGEILFFANFNLSSGDYIFLMFDTFFMILVNLYLFYTLDTFTENKELKYKLVLYERQAQSNYDYYARQIENNKIAMKVTHDLRKHVQIIEGLKQYGTSRELWDYIDNFEEMISPLLTRQYCNNAILNIIIIEKVEYCKKNGIHFQVDIQSVDIDFVKPIDITTIFGNLLDNAIEACEKTEEKKMRLKIYPFNEFTYIQLSNSFNKKISWNKMGRPQSDKGEYHGIGLENVDNVLKKYNGNIQFTVKENNFIVEVMINQS